MILLKYELRRKKYPPNLYLLLILSAVAAGMIGSKLYYCLEEWSEFTADPLGTLFDTAGSGWYGGLIGGGLALVLILKIKRLPLLQTLDIIVPVMAISQVIGRLGCFMAGCCRGIISDVPWAVYFQYAPVPTSSRVHPTQLYEMLIYLGIFILLWKLRNKELKAGVRLSLYLILAGLGRFIVEFYRINPEVLLGFTAPQILATSGLVIGVLVLIHKSGITTPESRPLKY